MISQQILIILIIIGALLVILAPLNTGYLHPHVPAKEESISMKTTHRRVGGKITELMNGTSDKWIPAIIDSCQGLPPQSAPCLRQERKSSNLIKAQELIYSPFRLKTPVFAKSSDRDKWLGAAREYWLSLTRNHLVVSDGLFSAHSIDGDWLYYPAFYGQNLVFHRSAYRGDPPPDDWLATSCMGGNEDISSFFNQIPDDEEPLIDTLIIGTVPDDWNWQHFLDRMGVVWMQAMLAIPDSKRKEIVIVRGQDPDATVRELYDLFGAKRHIRNSSYIPAKRVVYSCQAPLVHPFAVTRINEVLGI